MWPHCALEPPNPAGPLILKIPGLPDVLVPLFLEGFEDLVAGARPSVQDCEELG